MGRFAWPNAQKRTVNIAKSRRRARNFKRFGINQYKSFQSITASELATNYQQRTQNKSRSTRRGGDARKPDGVLVARRCAVPCAAGVVVRSSRGSVSAAILPFMDKSMTIHENHACRVIMITGRIINEVTRHCGSGERSIIDGLVVFFHDEPGAGGAGIDERTQLAVGLPLR